MNITTPKECIKLSYIIIFSLHLLRAIYIMSKYLIHIRINMLILIILLVSFYTNASVVINSNRIIYPASIADLTIEFFNHDNSPYIIQIWTDINNPHSTVKNADGPFIVYPPIFKISSNSSQMVRLQFVGNKTLPNDRESIFYFNFLQVPSLKQENTGKNKLALLITHRLKIFYRPSEIPESPEDITKKLIFNYKNKTLEVINNSAYHANFIEAKVVDLKGRIIMTIPNISMVAPKSSKNWNISHSLNKKNLFINYFLVNEYGVAEKFQAILN